MLKHANAPHPPTHTQHVNINEYEVGPVSGVIRNAGRRLPSVFVWIVLPPEACAVQNFRIQNKYILKF